MPSSAAPQYPPAPHCNTRGLTDLGRYLIQRMIDKKMIFDPDHMSARARQAGMSILEAQGYDYIWRPTRGDDVPPFYAWFIKRDPATGVRTHHIHMVEPHFEHWDSLLFRDYLIAHPDVAAEYAGLKRRLAAAHAHDRETYTNGKREFIQRITRLAKGISRP